MTPLLIFFCLARLEGIQRRKVFLTLLVTGILAITAFRTGVALTHSLPNFESWDLLLRKRVLTRLDSVGFGMLGAYVFAFHAEAWKAAKRPLLVIGLLLIFYDYLESITWQHEAYRNFLQLTLAPIGTLFLLPCLTGIETGQGVLHAIFTFISKISYSMYLLHFSVIQMLLIPAIFSRVHGGDLEKLAVYYGLTIVLSYFLFSFYELPMMNLRDRLNLARGRRLKD